MAFTSIAETLPGMSNQRCASASVVSISSEPPREDSAPNVNTPATRTFSLPPGAITSMTEPTWSFWSLASFWTIETSPDALGGPPSTYVVLLMSPGAYEKKSVGEPPVDTTFPLTATAPVPAT